MKFLVDAQLPRRLAEQLAAFGHDVIHTRDLPLANCTPDRAITELAVRDLRVVITKDRDFVDSFVLRGEPPKLLLISTGNITNLELEALIAANLPQIVHALSQNAFVELSRSQLTIHA